MSTDIELELEGVRLSKCVQDYRINRLETGLEIAIYKMGEMMHMYGDLFDEKDATSFKTTIDQKMRRKIMPKFLVTLTISYAKELPVYAKDEWEAEEKATDIVQGWDNVDDCEVIDVIED